MSTVESIARPRRNGERRRAPTASRSEERFSRNAETDLVCRLLLEKKNLPVDDHARAEIRRRIADALGELVDSGRRKLLLVTSVDGAEPASSPLAPELLRAGFTPGARGWLRRPRERAVNTA